MTALSTLINYLNNLVDPQQSNMEAGTALYEAGDFEAALPRLEAALAETPEAPLLHLMVGRIHLANRDRGRALAHLEFAAAWEQDNGRIQYQIGELHKAQGDMAAAEAAFRAATEQNPRLTDAFIQRGLVMLELSRADEAAKMFEQAIYLDRSAVVARLSLAKICIERQDLRRAQTQLFYIKQAKPDYAPTYLLMAEIAEKLGDFRQVIVELQQAIKLGLGQADTHYRMGVAHIKLKDFAGAIGCMQRAIALGFQKWDAHCHLAQAHEALHQYQQAIGIYRQLTRVAGYQLFGKRGVDRVAPILASIEAGLVA